MHEVKKKIRRCENAILLIGFLTAFVLMLVWQGTGNFYYSFLIGYAIGFLSFMVLAESYVALEKMSQSLSILTLILSNLKLLAIAILVFVLKKLGFSVIEVIFGLLFSQFALFFLFLITLYLEKKTVEEYKNKANDART